DDIQPSLDRIDHTILPYLARKDPGTGYSTTVMIGGTAAGFGGAASALDQNGHMICFPATAGTKSLHLPCGSSVTDPTKPGARACAALREAMNASLGYLPLSTAPPGSGG